MECLSLDRGDKNGWKKCFFSQGKCYIFSLILHSNNLTTKTIQEYDFFLNLCISCTPTSGKLNSFRVFVGDLVTCKVLRLVACLVARSKANCWFQQVSTGFTLWLFNVAIIAMMVRIGLFQYGLEVSE